MLMKTLENKNIWKNLFLILCILFIMPSIIYLLRGNKINDLISSFTFFYTEPSGNLTFIKILSTILFIGLFGGIAFVYYKILKYNKKIFTNNKKMAIFIVIISILFLIMLPLTSTDVFYYIGTGWSEANYGINPYYTSVDSLIAENEEAKTDEILEKMPGIWKWQTIVYGPVWPLICKILSGLSMGNLMLALLIYKMFNLILHLANTYLIYKITNKRKLFTLMYGLNPLVLFDGITNVHNEILVIFLILAGLYFFIKKKNILLTVIFFALATAVKYFAILLIPFVILYYYRDKKPLKKILYSALWAIVFLLVVAACYLMYMQDIEVFKGVLTQQAKFVNSIFCTISLSNEEIAKIVAQICMLGFVIIYLFVIIRLIFTKRRIYTFSGFIRKYNLLLILFLFGTITNFQSWYTLWILPTLIWEGSKNLRWMLPITIFAELCNIVFFITFEHVLIGMPYSIALIVLIVLNLGRPFLKKRQLPQNA